MVRLTSHSNPTVTNSNNCQRLKILKSLGAFVDTRRVQVSLNQLGVIQMRLKQP